MSDEIKAIARRYRKLAPNAGVSLGVARDYVRHLFETMHQWPDDELDSRCSGCGMSRLEVLDDSFREGERHRNCVHVLPVILEDLERAESKQAALGDRLR